MSQSCHPLMRPVDPLRRSASWCRVLAAAGILSLPLVSTVGGGLGAQEPPGSDALLVLAASSLTDVLPRVADAWREAGGGRVRFSFDATSRLASQAVQGANADLFFSADEGWMDWLAGRKALLAASRRVVATNELVVVVPRGGFVPAAPPDLARVHRLALASENAPAGRYAREALEAAGVWDLVASRVVHGGSVRSALEWVARGDADAGIVYATDAMVQPSVDVAFSFPAHLHRPIWYSVAILSHSARRDAARAFLDFATGPSGRAIFAAEGFARPDATDAGPSSAGSFEAAVPDPWSAIRLSFIVAVMASLLGLAPAVALGWILARKDFTGKSVLTTLVMAPMVMPPVVTGFLLLVALGARSPVGRALELVGMRVPFTLLGAGVAALVVGLPLYVMAIRGAFEAVDPHLEEVAWTLGDRPRRTFVRVSLPLALPGVAAGAVLAFARALGEFGATVVLAGNVEGSTRTIALAIYMLLESPAGRGATWMLVSASVVISLAALMGFEALSRRQRGRLEGRRGR